MKLRLDGAAGATMTVLAFGPLMLLACSGSSSAPGGDAGGALDGGPGADGSSAAESGAMGDDAATSGDDTARDGGGDSATSTAHDAATTDAAPAAGCGGTTGALLCEDFETGHLNTATWMSSTQEATVVVDSMHAHSGTYALHVHATADGGANGTITETKTFPAAAAHFFGRAMVWMDDPSPNNHAAYIAASDASQNNTYTLGSQYHTFLALSYAGNNEDGSDHSATAVPTGGWACYEWEFDGANGSANYWINGQDLTDIDRTTWAMASFASLDIGLTLFGSDAPNPPSFDLWYDDIVIATARVGCP
jgi:hypothetical protein